MRIQLIIVLFYMLNFSLDQSGGIKKKNTFFNIGLIKRNTVSSQYP